MRIELAVESLGELVRLMDRASVNSRPDYRQWAKEHQKDLKELFWYEQLPGMPNIHQLVSADFHPEFPLILLNYTPVAHSTLHEFEHGWTDPIRLCRGIVFDRESNLIALPYAKFFNYGQHPETMYLPPDEPFEATVKKDGHLGIIFEYCGRILLTTRGSFTSPSAIIGQQMIDKYVEENNWGAWYPTDVTLLTEIIHPETKVYLDYHSQRELCLIGAFHRVRYYDYGYTDLRDLADYLGLPLTEIWTGNSLDELVALMGDRNIRNQEGYVIRFQSGLRVKLKFKTHLEKMMADNLSYKFLMRAWAKGELEEKIALLSPRDQERTQKMLNEILEVVSRPGKLREKRRWLYEMLPKPSLDLDPEVEQSTSGYQKSCRQFLAAYLAK